MINVFFCNCLVDKFLFIGIVKFNFGYGEVVSGVIFFIKVILMLSKNMILFYIGIKGWINEKLLLLVDMNIWILFGKILFCFCFGGDGKRKIFINNFDVVGGNISMVIEDFFMLLIEGVDFCNYYVIIVFGKMLNFIMGNSKCFFEYLD